MSLDISTTRAYKSSDLYVTPSHIASILLSTIHFVGRADEVVMLPLW